MYYCKFEGTWNETSGEVGQMFNQSEALAAVTMATRCSYRTSLTPLILSQSEREKKRLDRLCVAKRQYFMSNSLSLSLKAEGTEAFPATFNGLLFNFPVLIHFYSSAFRF